MPFYRITHNGGGGQVFEGETSVRAIDAMLREAGVTEENRPLWYDRYDAEKIEACECCANVPVVSWMFNRAGDSVAVCSACKKVDACA